MIQSKLQILENTEIGPSYFKMAFAYDDAFKSAKPGQFIMVQAGEGGVPLLRRPFSIHNLYPADGIHKGRVEILYKVVGQGTRHLSMLSENDRVDILGPLGNSFEISPNSQNVALICGGIGIAPFLFLARYLKQNSVDLVHSKIFIGGRSKPDILCRNAFQHLGMRMVITTEDGTDGKKGLITEPFKASIGEKKPERVYACGPMPMLKAVSKVCEKFNLPCQVSIETMMACGIGACLGCAVKTHASQESYQHACLDGPVFDSRDIVNCIT